MTSCIENYNELKFGIAIEDVQLAKRILAETWTPEPYSGQVVGTIYFATREFNLPRAMVRTRKYGHQPFCYIELKTNEESPTTKSRSAKHLPETEARRMLASIDNKETLRAIATLGLDNNFVESVFSGIGYKPLLPLVETQSRRDYFGGVSNRVTLDIDEAYWGYFTESRDIKVPLGESGVARIEFKLAPDTNPNPILEMVISQGIALHPIEGRKRLFQRLYLTMMEQLNSQKEGGEYTDELPGLEVERKLQVQDCSHALDLANELFFHLGDGRIPEFRRMPGKEVIKEWEFDFINFGLLTQGQLVEAVVVVVDTEMERFAVKRKGDAIVYHTGSLVRPELVSKHLGKFEGNVKETILSQEKEKLGGELVEVGTIRRKKRYTYATHIYSGRNYKIGADVCCYGDHTMSQLEIEYIGRTDVHSPSKTALNEIEQELERLQEFVLYQYPGQTTPTKLTKFEWLTKICR